MLHGKQAELATVEALIEGARAGRGGTVVVEGDAGVGKTTLLDAARRGATGMQELRTSGLEAESSLPFSALAELTERLLDGIRALPEPQAAAIQGALALGPPAPGDRFAVCAGFLGLLSNAAREEPLLVVVDDGHWLDRASAECLGFAARRVSDLPVGILVAVRSGEPHAFSGSDVIDVSLSGLERGDARAVLDDVDPQLPARWPSPCSTRRRGTRSP